MSFEGFSQEQKTVAEKMLASSGLEGIELVPKDSEKISESVRGDSTYPISAKREVPEYANEEDAEKWIKEKGSEEVKKLELL